jgi:hypothetical protein
MEGNASIVYEKDNGWGYGIGTLVVAAIVLILIL